MEHRCDICNRSFNSEDSLNQHNNSKHIGENKKRKVNTKKYFIFFIVILIIVLFSISIYSFAKKPGQYDDFAKCLTEKGAVVYGNDFCSYTVKQLNFFGKSKKYLNYVKCIDNRALCNEKEITVTPTWEIDGQMYEQTQKFERLIAITGCEV